MTHRPLVGARKRGFACPGSPNRVALLRLPEGDDMLHPLTDVPNQGRVRAVSIAPPGHPPAVVDLRCPADEEKTE